MRTEKIMRFLLTCFLSVLILPLSIAAWAQGGRGGISGLVSDTSGAVIPNASVTLTDAATGNKLTTTSSGAGLYSFVSLAPGTYEITATAQGFDTIVQKNVKVTVDQ